VFAVKVEILSQNKMDKVAVKHVVYSLEQNTTQRIKKEVDGARVGRLWGGGHG
jgi:hypothetical protein